MRGMAVIVATVVVLDQATKLLALRNLALDDPVRGLISGEPVVLIPRLLQFIYAENTGGAFSIFSRYPMALTIISTLVAMILIVWSLKLQTDEMMMRWPLGMILGGAIGNLIDRYRLQHVIDFIDAHWDDVYHFPTFNVADSSICIGMALLIWLSFFHNASPAAQTKS